MRLRAADTNLSKGDWWRRPTKEDFLQKQAKARGDIPSLWGTSFNSTGDMCLSNDLHQIPGSPLTIRSLSTLITSRHLDLVVQIETKSHTISHWLERSVFVHHLRKKAWTFLSSKSMKRSRFCFIEASSWSLILLERLSHIYNTQLLPRERLTGGELPPHNRWQKHSPRTKGSARKMWLDWFLKCLEMPKNQVVFILSG